MVFVFINSLLIIVAINIAIYVWAYKNQSDHLTDISYSACFIGLAVFLYFVYSAKNQSSWLLLLMVLLWGFRLGGFLFYRIRKIGKDKRFNEFRGSWKGLLKFFLLQGISIWIISLPIMVFLTNHIHKEHSWLGLVIWSAGWLIEAVADYQKFNFKQQYPDTFFEGGLFRHIRHPNYLGEILVWLGIFIFTIPSLNGWQWVSIVGPVWITFLLVKVSGIPLLEEKAWKKYGDDPEFKNYLDNSWRLIPRVY